MMFPLVTVSMVEMQFKSVLLPEPDGPITPTNSPLQMSNDTSSSARDGLSRAVHLPNVAHGKQDVAAVGPARVRDACRWGCGNYGHGGFLSL